MCLLCLPLVIPALAGITARPLAGRLEPRHATWLLTTAAVALAVYHATGKHVRDLPISIEKLL